MKPARTLTACIAIGLSFFTVHAQFQVVHDVPNTTGTPQLTPLILGDNSTVTLNWEAGQHIFRKYDTNGDLVWSKALAGGSEGLWGGIPAISLMSDGADGFQFIRISGHTLTPIVVPFEQNELEISVQAGHVDGTGELTNTFLLKKTYTTLDHWFIAAEFNAVHTPDNGIILAMTYETSIGEMIDIVKTDSNGAVVWGRSVGHALTGLPGAVPTIPFDIGPRAKVVVSTSGRIYYTEGSDFSNSDLRLAELGSNGDMLWMKRYVYGNTDPSILFDGIQVDDAGNVHAAGSLTSSVGRFHILLRTNADGVLDRGDLYRSPLGIRYGELRLDEQGRRYQLVSTSDPSTGAISQGILIADTLGSPAQFLRRDDQVVLPNNVAIAPRHMDVAGDRLAFSGLLYHVDVDLAYTTRYETLSSIGTDEISSCLMDDTTFADIPIPLNIMTTEIVPDAASIDVSAYYSSQPLALTLTDVGTEPLEPLCTFINELLQNDVGVSEGSLPGEAPLVVSSPVAQGTSLVLNDSNVSAVDVYNIYGALVQHAILGGSRTLSTTGWATGVYILHAKDSRGVPLRTGRVVVE